MWIRRSYMLLLLVAAIVKEGSTFRINTPAAADHDVKMGFSSSASSTTALPAEPDDDDDWRAFRAKLVMQEKQPHRIPHLLLRALLTSDGWAYEAGNVIEKGSIILSRAQQDFGYGIRQQYFHKCVILVLHHDHNFTKGVILNRPTDLILGDKDFVNEDGKPLDNGDLDGEDEHRWKVWFGGDVQWIRSSPEVVCLHSLTSSEANAISETVMKEIQWTTLAGARNLVREGHAEPEDFYVVCGYAGWGAGQLLNELERGCWYMAATDSQTILMELRKQDRGTDPREAGLETWKLLMERIGKQQEANECEGGFDDLMLREWAKEKLIFTTESVKTTEQNVKEMVLLAATLMEQKDISAGRILRGSSSQTPPPFLLDDQEFHHSLVLIIEDNPIVSIGVILNLPSNQTVEVDIVGEDGIKRKTALPVRFGGRYGVKGENSKPKYWLHCSEILRDAKVGSPVGVDPDGIWTCTQEDAETALELGMVTPSEFIVVGGFSIWLKGAGTVGGLLGEVLEGKFESVPKNKTQVIWSMLRDSQDALSIENMDSVLEAQKSIWASLGGPSNDSGDKVYVYKSETTVESLVDDALRSWVAAVLLENPKLRLQR